MSTDIYIKEWLMRGRKLETEIKQLKEAKAEAFARASATTVNTSKERVQGGGGNGNERKLINYLACNELINTRIDELFAVKIELIKAINSLQDTMHRALLIAYYINCLTWEQVSEELGYDVRWIYRLHNKAIAEIKTINKY